MTGTGRPFATQRRRAWLAVLACALLPATADARPGNDKADGRPAAGATSLGAPWARMTVQPGDPVTTRPTPPREGRSRCIGVDNVAGAQLFGDSAIELTMKNGQQYRMFFSRECQALSFYQGFYYRRLKAGQLCAGRDVIGARSGGECPIAAIIPVRKFKRKR